MAIGIKKRWLPTSHQTPAQCFWMWCHEWKWHQTSPFPQLFFLPCLPCMSTAQQVPPLAQKQHLNTLLAEDNVEMSIVVGDGHSLKGQQGKYCSCCNVPCMWPFPLTVETIPCSPAHCPHSCMLGLLFWMAPTEVTYKVCCGACNIYWNDSL